MSGSDATTPILLALGWGTINPREIGVAGVDVSSTDSNLNCSQVGAGEGQWQAELRRRGADVSWAFSSLEVKKHMEARFWKHDIKYTMFADYA